MSLLRVGIDLGVTARHVARIVGPAIDRPFVFSTAADQLAKLVKIIEGTGVAKDDVAIVLEPTGMSWFHVAWFLKEQGYKVYRVNPAKTKDLRNYFKRHLKTDDGDAKVLAEVGRDANKLVPLLFGSSEEMALARFCRQRAKLQERVGQDKKRIKALCETVMPGLPKVLSGALLSSYGRALLRRYIDPRNIDKTSLDALQAFLFSNGMKITDRSLAKGIKEVAEKATMLSRDSDSLPYEEIQVELGIMIDLLEFQESKVAELDKRIKRLYEAVDPQKLLETIPGLGPALAPLVHAMVGNAERFSSTKKFKAYTGYIPKVSESGVRAVKGLGITKAGPNLLKRSLYLAADVARRYDPQMALVYYRQMVEKNQCHKQALCCVANRLSARILTVLKEQRPYVLRDLQGEPIDKKLAQLTILDQLNVPESIRSQKRVNRETKMERSLRPRKRQS